MNVVPMEAGLAVTELHSRLDMVRLHTTVELDAAPFLEIAKGMNINVRWIGEMRSRR